MLVIHGAWAYDVLWLWAEDSELPAELPVRLGRPSRAPRRHPFGCDPAALADSLAEFGGPVAGLARKAVDDELTLHLPSRADGPLASPQLSRVPEEPATGSGAATGSRPRLGAWRVPALTFEPAAALDLLVALAGPEPERPAADGSQPGEPGAAEPVTARSVRAALAGSVPYLAAVATLARDMAGRGRVLPVLAGGDGDWAARWRPVVSGADAERARELAAAMPPACRAADAVGEPAGQVLASALNALADAAARARLAGMAPAPRRGRAPSRVPVAGRWLDALTAADGRVEVAGPADEHEAAELAGQLADWHATAQVPAGPVRTCFRLTEPEAAEGAWRVEFSLQSTADPSLVIPADDVWAGEPIPSLAGIAHPEEELLGGLGRASRLFPELDTELRTAAPAAAVMDTAEVSRFLRETAPLLAGAGFGVLLPDWARKARLGLRLTARTRTSSGAGDAGEPRFGLADLVDFRYELAVGDEAIDPDELAELARLKIPLVRVRGQWVELDETHLRAALRFLERGGDGTMSAGDALLAGLRGEEDLPVVSASADGWLGDLLSGEAERRLEPVPAPASFAGLLRPYQERGLAWLTFLSRLGLGGILADSMGLGKTIQLLALLAHERDGVAPGSEAPGPTLLVCPMSLVGNWEQEAARFVPGLRLHTHHGPGRLSGEELTAALVAADLVVSTYAIAARDAAALGAVDWARVVCDEAQNIKNSSARQSRAVRGLRARSRIALTGTPVENRLSELWSIMEFTNPGLLGSAQKFRSALAVPIERHGDEEATARLRRLTGPFILRRLKTDSSIISDLPDKLEMKVWCNLTAEQASLYQATVTDMLARIEAAEEGIARRGLVLATMTRLKQVCNHPAHLLGDGSRLPGRSGKLARLEEICEQIVADGEKALCFTQYAEFGSMLAPYLTARLGCPVLFLHGGTTKRRRDEMVSKFTSITRPAVFLLSLKAGGTGLNLTAASHVIHIDRWWNPAVEEQATDRAFRIGQTKDVQVRKFICAGTLEERIDQMIEEKRQLAERIVGSGESWLADLSVADLRRVISLSPEAVSQ